MAEISVTDTQDAAPKEWRRGWPIVLASLVGIMLCLSPVPYWALIVIGPELSAEFGWSRVVTSAGFLYMTAGVLVAAPVVGTLVDRIGARPVLLPSIVALGLGVMAFSLMTPDPRVFYLIFFLTAVLGTGTLPITWTKAIVNNFDRYRGLALGVALTGTGLFGFIATPTIQWLIDSFGWRTAYVCVGALPLLISLPLAFLLFRDTKEADALDGTGGVGRPLLVGAAIAAVLFVAMTTLTQALGVEAVIGMMALFLLGYVALVYVQGGEGSRLPGLSIQPALRDYRFWLIFIAFLILGAAVSGIIANSKFILLDKGYTPQAATSYLIGAGVIGLSTIVGRLIGGFLVDHIWAPLVAFVFMSVPAIGCFILAGDMGVGANVFALVLVGVAAGVEFDLMAYFVSRYFGMKAYGRIYGLVYAAFGLGSGTSPVIFNILRGGDADYSGVLTTVAVLFVVGGVMLLGLGRYRDFGAPAHA